MRAGLTIVLTGLLFLGGCSSKGDGDKINGSSGGSSGSSNQPGGGGGGGSGSSSGGRPGNFGGMMHTGPMFAGAECPTDVGFADAYALPNLKGAIDGSNVRLTFDPQGDAADYRVYVLPKGGDVSGNTVQNAVYRCAGNYAVPAPAIDDATMPDSPGIRTRVASKVNGFARTKEDATLGYVFTTPADDRIPVYALGDPQEGADNATCYQMRWPESRVKRYTTSEQERKDLIAKRWRDDGVVFYVPKPGAEGTHPIYLGVEPSPPGYPTTLYLKDGPELEDRKAQNYGPTEVFSVYSETQDGAEPLMRVFYAQTCALSHDELVAGLARFNKAHLQGASPVAELHFSGLTEETTLVVEALDQQCPWQGIVSPTSRPARLDDFGANSINYPAFLTPEEIAAASPTGEVFVNGQGSGTTPKAIARACVKVKPEAPPEMDFFYDGSPQVFSEAVNKGFQIWEIESDTFNVQLHTMATDEWGVGTMFGELWATYADWAADTNGKLRITPKARATLAAETFIHASMEVDTVSTQRRYPQLFISDVEWPVQDNLEKGASVLIQTFGGITTPVRGEIQFCDHRSWDVNNQCPTYDTYLLKDGDQTFLSPQPEINGFSGVDRTMRFDAYVSTSRVYWFTNGIPYACVDLPSGKLKAGPATVTFADVLYHSGADLADWYPFHLERMHTHTSRHYSNLGFSSGVGAPAWDESLIPCVPASGLK